MSRAIDQMLAAVGRAVTVGAWANRAAVVALRGVLAAIFIGVLLTGAVLFPVMASQLTETYPEAAFVRWPLLVLVLLGLAMVEVAVVCVGRLLTEVVQATAFSRHAYRYVDAIIAAGTIATLLGAAALVVQIATAALQPGLLLVTLGAILVGTGVTLLVVVLRALLVRAVALDAELGEVI
ncbi:MAG: DUF2975 domain-containing protein [Promicromonosporaceae bacterium]|nr:DUF2975 domain-containing protein [Promicromonosporaceae bacterium]